MGNAIGNTTEQSIFSFRYNIITDPTQQRNCSGFSLLSPLCSPLARLHAEWLPDSGH